VRGKRVPGDAVPQTGSKGVKLCKRRRWSGLDGGGHDPYLTAVSTHPD